MKIHELKYSNTNTYLIEGKNGCLLFDTGWAGTFPAFLRAMGELGIPAQRIDYILISHFHPDHCGIAQEIASLGPKIAVMDVQKEAVHTADAVFAKDRHSGFVPIRDESVKLVRLPESRGFLREMGIDGEILHTPGHSADSISLCLDNGTFFVGDLNPLYELELHRGTQIEETWERLLNMKPDVICYGHAKTAVLKEQEETAVREPEERAQTGALTAGKRKEAAAEERRPDLEILTGRIMKYIDRGVSLERIGKKTGAPAGYIEDVARMYLTHPNVSVRGILDRIEIKGM